MNTVYITDFIIDSTGINTSITINLLPILSVQLMLYIYTISASPTIKLPLLPLLALMGHSQIV